MHVGIPTEVKNHEYRVAITPAGVLRPAKGELLRPLAEYEQAVGGAW